MDNKINHVLYVVLVYNMKNKKGRIFELALDGKPDRPHKTLFFTRPTDGNGAWTPFSGLCRW